MGVHFFFDKENEICLSVLTEMLFLSLMCLVGHALAMPSISDTLTNNNASQILGIVVQKNDTRFVSPSTDGPFTLLVPVDSAFAKLSASEIANLQNNAQLLDEVLGVHVIRGELFSWDFINGRVIVSDN